jgi:uncharacterized membrane protein HdeD (DUF308 family)
VSHPFDAGLAREPFAEPMSQHWAWFLAEGIVLLILGLLAVLLPWATSLATTLIAGALLLLSGIVGLIATFRTRNVPGFAWSLLSAVLGVGTGMLLIIWPMQGGLAMGAFFLTLLLLTAFLLAEGVFSIFYALEHRKGLSGRWGWLLASGLIDISLGVLLITDTLDVTWALTLILALSLGVGGLALLTMSLAARPRGKMRSVPARSL